MGGHQDFFNITAGWAAAGGFGVGDGFAFHGEWLRFDF